MSSKTTKHVKSLQTTKDALSKIRKELKPFIRQLDSDDAAKKAQAQAVVALSMGTLRYMGARLQGKTDGKTKEDPLRQELDKMRKVLVDLETKNKGSAAKSNSGNTKKDTGGNAGKEEKKDTPAPTTVEKKKKETETATSAKKTKKRSTPTKRETPKRSAKKSRKT